MTEKDAVEEIVKQSYTLKVNIEELRRWAKEKFAKAVRERDEVLYDPDSFCKLSGEIHAYGRLIQKLDEIERGKWTE